MTEAEKFAYKSALAQAVNALQFASVLAKLLGLPKDEEALTEAGGAAGTILARIYQAGVKSEPENSQ